MSPRSWNSNGYNLLNRTSIDASQKWHKHTHTHIIALKGVNKWNTMVCMAWTIDAMTTMTSQIDKTVFLAKHFFCTDRNIPAFSHLTKYFGNDAMQPSKINGQRNEIIQTLNQTHTAVSQQTSTIINQLLARFILSPLAYPKQKKTLWR